MLSQIKKVERWKGLLHTPRETTSVSSYIVPLPSPFGIYFPPPGRLPYTFGDLDDCIVPHGSLPSRGTALILSMFCRSCNNTRRGRYPIMAFGGTPFVLFTARGWVGWEMCVRRVVLITFVCGSGWEGILLTRATNQNNSDCHTSIAFIFGQCVAIYDAAYCSKIVC